MIKIRTALLYFSSIILLVAGCKTTRQANAPCVTNKETSMIEKFDIEEFEAGKMRGKVLANGNKITAAGRSSNRYTEPIYFFDEQLSAPYYCQAVWKTFYANYNLKRSETRFGEHTVIGITKEYDECGNLVKEIDEDAKFKDVLVKPDDLIDLLVKYEILHPETKKVIIKDPQNASEEVRYYFNFFNPESGSWNIPVWKVRTPNFNIANFDGFTFYINAYTGKILRYHPHNFLAIEFKYLEQYYEDEPIENFRWKK